MRWFFWALITNVKAKGEENFWSLMLKIVVYVMSNYDHEAWDSYAHNKLFHLQRFWFSFYCISSWKHPYTILNQKDSNLYTRRR